MDWIRSVQQAINYIEDNLLEELDADGIAAGVYSSSAHFQRIFSMVAGMSIGDYIRSRRLSLAGEELADAGIKVIDAALKYGYETPESFSKAFVRFHGMPPSAARLRKHFLMRFEPLSIRIDIKGGFDMSRKVIPNVPLMTMSADGYAYLTSFVGSLYAALKVLDEPYDHTELLACSGLGNRLCWTAGRWVFGNEDIENCNEVPFELQGRLLAAFGWKAKHIVPQRDAHGGLTGPTEEEIVRDFVHCLDRGIPVLAQGITDDGCKHDYDIIYGYEGDGARIIGWDYYQTGDRPMIRVDWARELGGYVVLGERTKPMPERERVLLAFGTICRLARLEELRGRKMGLAAWAALLDQLEHDDFSACTLYPAQGLECAAQSANSLQHRFIIYCDALAQISQRGSVLPYFRSIAGRYPEWAEHLSAAIAAWEQCAAYGGYLWSIGLSFDEAGYESFRSPAVRKQLADAGRAAMRREAEAVEHIEAILHAEKQ